MADHFSPQVDALRVALGLNANADAFQIVGMLDAIPTGQAADALAQASVLASQPEQKEDPNDL